MAAATQPQKADSGARRKKRRKQHDIFQRDIRLRRGGLLGFTERARAQEIEQARVLEPPPKIDHAAVRDRAIARPAAGHECHEFQC